LSKKPRKTKETDHVTVKIPQELVAEMDKLIGKHGFRSRGEIAKEAIRELLAEYEKLPFEMLNHDGQGVKVLDRQLGRVADIQFNPKGIYCPVCDAHFCGHIRFALNQSDVQKIVKQKQKEGWKIDLPDET